MQFCTHFIRYLHYITSLAFQLALFLSFITFQMPLLLALNQKTWQFKADDNSQELDSDSKICSTDCLAF